MLRQERPEEGDRRAEDIPDRACRGEGSGESVPERVTVALAEIAESAREGLLALAVGAGLQVLQALMAESVTALAGPRGRHDPDRVAVRHGSRGRVR